MTENCVNSAYLNALQTKGVQTYVSNALGRVERLSVDGLDFPLSIHEPVAGQQQSYVSSPCATYGKYALTELETLPTKGLHYPLSVLIKGVDGWLAGAGFDKVVSLNNWFLSTNLFPHWSPMSLKPLTAQLCDRFPDSFLITRSLNGYHHAALIQRFVEAGWQLLPARRIWRMEPKSPHKRDRKADDRLLAKTPYQRVSADTFSASDFDRAKDLYDQLYLDKYSGLNPAFTAELLKFGHSCGMFRLEALRNEAGQLDGIAGTIRCNGVITTPVFGYDTSLPQKLGLYRMLSAIAFDHMEQAGCSYNLSAGAGSFKRLRGAEPTIEWTACYMRHLPFARRLPIGVLRTLLQNIGVPLMNRFDL